MNAPVMTHHSSSGTELLFPVPLRPGITRALSCRHTLVLPFRGSRQCSVRKDVLFTGVTWRPLPLLSPPSTAPPHMWITWVAFSPGNRDD